MPKSTNEYAAAYRALLLQGEVQQAYHRLMQCLMEVKAHFARALAPAYSCGNISPGYMDYSYFPFSNDFLRGKKLRFGIVLNHRETRFELWLMGQNAQVQKEYWELLRHTRWNRERTAMPQYSVLEAVLVPAPDFDRPQVLCQTIEAAALAAVEEILPHLAR